MPDQWADRAYELYRQHLGALRSPLPADAMRLVESLTLHDALLRHFAFDEPTRTLTLRWRAGDLQVGYFDVELQYSSARLDPQSQDVLRRALNRREVQLLDDEFDEADGGAWSHRFLFAPDGEAAVIFGALLWERTDRTGRF